MLTCWHVVRNILRPAASVHRHKHRGVRHILSPRRLALARVVCSVTAIGAIGTSHFSVPPVLPPAATHNAAAEDRWSPEASTILPDIAFPVSELLSGLDLEQPNQLATVSDVLGPGAPPGIGPIGPGGQPLQPVNEPTAVLLFAPAVTALIAVRVWRRRPFSA